MYLVSLRRYLPANIAGLGDQCRGLPSKQIPGDSCPLLKVLYDNMTIACVYRSPDGCLISFLEKLEILLNSLTNKNSQLILCGDFNINFLDSNSNIVSEFRSVIHSFNLGELITSPTRITFTSKTCLDQIIINQDFFSFAKTKNINLGLSDHNSIFLYLEIDRDIHSKNIKSVHYRRTYNEANIAYFQFLLKKESWHNMLNKQDLDEKTLEFMETVTYCFNTAFPIKKFISPINYSKMTKKWLTKGIITSCKRKRYLHELCLTSDDVNIKQYYRKYCNILRKVIYQAKLKSNQDFIMQAGNKGKAIWDVIK